MSIDPDFCLPSCEGFQFPQKDTYVGMDAAEHFLDYVIKVADLTYKKYIEEEKKIIFTREDEEKFDMADECHICDKRFVRAIAHCHNKDEMEDDCSMCEVNTRADEIVKDHCHVLGHFRGAVHNTCNLR